jgi:SAM-dependent methyltransferase
MRTRGEPWPQDFERRLDPDARVMEDRLVDLFTRVPTERVRILDVGAGPLTVLGKVLPGRRLEIHPIDALADDYDRLLAEAGIVPSVRTVRCTAEEVARRYAQETFDIAHARNCLDHALDPLRAIEGMFAVVRTGGFIVLSHERNVGDGTGYDGLHQWNFDAADDDLLVWRGEFVHRIGQRLGSAAQVEVQPWKRRRWPPEHRLRDPQGGSRTEAWSWRWTTSATHAPVALGPVTRPAVAPSQEVDMDDTWVGQLRVRTFPEPRPSGGPPGSPRC